MSAKLRSAAVLVLALAMSAANSADYPERAVKIVVPFTAGTSSDLLVRQISPFLQGRWQQPLIVENKPGAGGQIGNVFVAHSPADGYTLLIGSQSIGLQKHLVKDLGFDPDKDLVALYKLVVAKVVLATNTEVPAKNLDEFAMYSRRNPGKLFYGGTGPASLSDQAIEMIKRDLKLDLTAVSYPGPPQYVTALIRNDVQLTYGVLSAMKPHMDAGKARALAVVNYQRLQEIPEVPTLSEAGYTGQFIPVPWVGMFAPVGVPKEILGRLGQDFGAAMADPATKSALDEKLGLLTLRSSPEAFTREYVEEMKIWASAFKSANIAPQ